MENKPVFCSECGAPLTGSATFCASCGAKQSATLAQPAAPAPETSLANPKPKLSVFALVLTLLAMATTFCGILMTFFQYTVMMGKDFPNMGQMVLSQNSTGMILAWVVPLAALVFVFAKNKKLAVAGLILAGGSLLMQFVFGIVYVVAIRGGVDMNKLSFILRPLNGEGLFMEFYRIARGGGSNTSREIARLLLSLGSSLCYYMKNILCAVACLMVAVKKAK